MFGKARLPDLHSRHIHREHPVAKNAADLCPPGTAARGRIREPRSRAVVPAVRDRNALVATLRQLLGDVGLKRRGEELVDLGSCLARRARDTTSQEEGHMGQEGHSICEAPFGTTGTLPPLGGRVVKTNQPLRGAHRDLDPHRLPWTQERIVRSILRDEPVDHAVDQGRTEKPPPTVHRPDRLGVEDVAH